MTYNFGWGCLESDYWILFLIYIESILKISPLWALAIQRSTTKEEHGQTLLRVVASVLKIHWWLQELLMQTLTYLQFVDRTQGNTVRLVICDLYWKCIYIYIFHVLQKMDCISNICGFHSHSLRTNGNIGFQHCNHNVQLHWHRNSKVWHEDLSNWMRS